jgi:hypothetical protein
MPRIRSGASSIIALMRCVKCHVVRYCNPSRLANLSEEMPLLLVANRWQAMIQMQIGR